MADPLRADRRHAAGRADQRARRDRSRRVRSACCRERTKIVAISHVSNALGTINPVRDDDRTRRTRAGAVVLVDGAQAVPHFVVDVQALDCDFYVFSSHKMFGPTGTGVLYGRRALLEAMPPYRGGGDMIASVTFEKTTYNHVPYKFEAGTPNMAGVVGLGRGHRLPRARSIARRRWRTKTSCSRTPPSGCARCRARASIGEAREKTGVLSFVIDGVHPHDVGTILDREGIAVRTGQHCAQPVMDRYGIAATIRASLAHLQHARGHRRADRGAGARAGGVRLMSDLTDLYQEVILDHNRRPRNFRAIEQASRTQEGYNPLCGDRLTLYVKLDGDRIGDVAFQGSGCAISKASASLMTEALKGKTVDEARALFERFHDMVTSSPDTRRAGSRQAVGARRACASFRRASSARAWPGTR